MELLGLAVAVFVGPAVLAYALRKTSAWWLAGTGTAVFGVARFLTLDHTDHHGEGSAGAAGMSAIGNAVQVMFGVFMLLYALVLVLASHSSRKAAFAARPQLPTATMLPPSGSS